MSRGGRGGGRGGGAGGRRMPGGPSWDMGDEIDGRPSDLFPKYDVPQSKSLSKVEERRINHFLLFRRQVHSSSLYTRKRTAANDVLKARRIYGQEQVNQKYRVKSKATVDPFTAIETYSQRFVEEDRTLPDFSTQPFCKDLFPSELHATINGDDCPANQRRRRREKRLELSNITTTDELHRLHGDDPDARVRALAANLEDGDEDAIEGVHKPGDDESDHGADDDEEEDYAYDDEDGGDYDAEGYFDDGDDDDMDDGDDGEAVY